MLLLRSPGEAATLQAGPFYRTCHILTPSETYRGLFFGCVCRLRRETSISQTWLKGRNAATLSTTTRHDAVPPHGAHPRGRYQMSQHHRTFGTLRAPSRIPEHKSWSQDRTLSPKVPMPMAQVPMDNQQRHRRYYTRATTDRTSKSTPYLSCKNETT